MSVRIIKQGILDTIQDAGRYGYQHLGINPCGVMDAIAMSVANILAGNKKNEPVTELHYPASSFLFEDDCIIAIAGADFCPTVNNEPIPIITPVIVSKNSLLQFTQFRKGARCYLAVYGGWDIEDWLNSYSTHLKAKCGGFNGRSLKKDDVLGIKPQHPFFSATPRKSFIPLTVNVNISELYALNQKIRCVKGSEYDWLTDDGKKIFETSLFRITVQSDRMGYCLHGDPLISKTNKQLLSSAVTRGTIQLLPSGQLIILMADHQTTGGYPKVAHAISTDIPKLAQMRPNETMQFELIDYSEAENLFVQQQQYLQQFEDTIHSQLKQFFSNAHY